MPKIGARFYTHLELLENHADMMETELLKEMDNGRLYRLLVKLGTINEREWVVENFRNLKKSFHICIFRLNLDVTWSETGNRYMLKLFRDYLWVANFSPLNYFTETFHLQFPFGNGRRKPVAWYVAHRVDIEQVGCGNDGKSNSTSKLPIFLI